MYFIYEYILIFASHETEVIACFVFLDLCKSCCVIFFQILVWHTRTEKADLRNEAKFKNLEIQLLDPRIEV